MISVKEIKELEIYKELEDMGLAIRNTNLIFNINMNVHHVFDLHGQTDQNINTCGVIIEPGNTGHVSSYYKGDYENGDIFDCDTLDGWKYALEFTKTEISKIVNYLEEEGYTVFLDKKIIHDKRGLIISKKFGF